jgi:hypothetical protein
MANTSLPLTSAYAYLKKEGYENVVSKIQKSDDEFNNDVSSARRAKIVTLLEIVDLLDDFCEKDWPDGKTDHGKKKLCEYRHRFLKIIERED